MSELTKDKRARIRAGYEQQYRDYVPLIGYKWPDPTFHDGDIVQVNSVMTENCYVSLPGHPVNEAVSKEFLESLE